MMKTDLENISNLEKKLKIEVPQDKVNQEFQKAFKHLQKEANIKGFRKGKAPLEKIRVLYGGHVKNDVAQNIVQSFYWDALKEHNLTPISMPSIDFTEIEENSPFTFTANFEVRPEIKIVKKSGFSIEKEKLNISDEKINEVVENIRASHATFQTASDDSVLENGHFAIIDFEGFVDDKPLENGTATDHQLEIGSNQFIPGFEEALIGMKKSEERTVNIKFPDDYHVDDLKGKPVTFKVTLKEIKTKALPEINEEFLKKIDQTSIDDLKADIRKEIEASEQKRIDSETREKVMKAFVEANPVEVPNSLLKEQRDALVKDFQNRLKTQGFTEDNFDEYQNKWKEDFDGTAKFMVQSAFLIDQFAEEEKLKANPQDVENKITEMAKQIGMERDKVASFYKERNGLQRLEYQITEDNVYDFLLKNSTVTEVEKKS